VSIMGFTCPRGHESVGDEYCDVCGTPNPAVFQVAGDPTDRMPSGQVTSDQMCLVCGTQRDGVDRYCTNCGYDFEMGEPLVAAVETPPAEAPPEPVGEAPSDGAQAPQAASMQSLVLVVGVNTGKFEEPDCPPPPSDVSERVFIVDRSSIVIGRESPSLDIPIHGDPYVSRRHAEVVWLGNGWGIRDLGSTNGTKVNGVALEGREVKPLESDAVIELGFFSQLMVRNL
jgi:FHA domain